MKLLFAQQLISDVIYERFADVKTIHLTVFMLILSIIKSDYKFNYHSSVKLKVINTLKIIIMLIKH